MLFRSDAQSLAPVQFTYRGDGSGPIRLHILPNRFTGRFGGAIDDLVISEVTAEISSERKTEPNSEPNPGTRPSDLAANDDQATEQRVLFREDFSACQPGAIRGVQAHTQRVIYAKSQVPDWIGGGINHSHIVNRGDERNPNFAVQFYSEIGRAHV